MSKIKYDSSKDINIENFTLSVSGKQLLTNSQLKIVFGKRYGLIGKNGIGKVHY